MLGFCSRTSKILRGDNKATVHFPMDGINWHVFDYENSAINFYARDAEIVSAQNATPSHRVDDPKPKVGERPLEESAQARSSIYPRRTDDRTTTGHTEETDPGRLAARGERKYAGLGLSELCELRQLREENTKLKRFVADRVLAWLRYRKSSSTNQIYLYHTATNILTSC